MNFTTDLVPLGEEIYTERSTSLLGWAMFRRKHYVRTKSNHRK